MTKHTAITSVAAVAAVLMSGYALFRPAPVAGDPPAPPAAALPHAPAYTPLQRSPRIVRDDDDAAPAPVAVAAAVVDRPARYTSLDVPEPAVAVEQVEDGSLSATNTDPALTGQVLIVEVEDEDGTRARVPIIVPPPSK